MRYAMPNHPCDFEIPDAWVIEAGFLGFTPNRPAFRSTATAVPVPLREIEPPYRTLQTPKGWRGFDQARLVRVLQGIVEDAEIEPVPLLELLPVDDVRMPPYGYRVLDGFHRFYGSIAAGFECLPSVIK